MAAAPQLIPSVVPFRLPLRAAALAAFGGAAARRRPLRATDEVSNEHPTVLVVEPDERSRSLLLSGLSQEGFEVLAAASLEEAMRYLQPDRALPAMIFCEADLRSGDGFSLCQQVRSEQRTADLPVVLLSHSPESYHRELAGGVGADQYLPKPLYLNDVVALAKLMAGSSSTAARFVTDAGTVAISQALRALLSGVRAGRIELARSRGWIAFREGRVVDAAMDGLRGEAALLRVLLFGHGEYSVTFGPALTRATMTFGLEDLCRRMMPRLRRWQNLVARAVPLEAVLVVDFAQLKAHLEALPDDVNRVIRLFDGRRTVRDAVLETGFDEVLALEAVTRLYALGVLTPERSEQEPVTVVPAPVAFFEPAVPAAWTASASAPAPRAADLREERPASMFEATGVLDAEMIRQLEAFRIKTVVEKPEVPSRSEAQHGELESFVAESTGPAKASSSEQDPAIDVASAMEEALARHVPMAGERAELTASAAPEVQDALGLTASAAPAISAQPVVQDVIDLPGSANVAGAVRLDVEDSFFSETEDTADLSPVVQQAAARRSRVVPLLVAGVLAVCAAVVAVTMWPASSGPATQAAAPVAPVVVASSPSKPAVAAETAPAVVAAVASAQPVVAAPVAAVEPAFTEVVLSESPATAVAAATELYEAGKYREAISTLEEITSADPTVSQAWLLMGLAKFDRGDRRGAERATMEALALEPNNGRAMILLASIFLEQGQDAKANVELKRYLQVHPKGPFAREARELLGR